MLGVPGGGVAVEGVDGGEPLAAGPSRVVPLVFEHGQETADRRGVEVGEVEVGGPGAGLLADPGEQEPERVAFDCHVWLLPFVSDTVRCASFTVTP